MEQFIRVTKRKLAEISDSSNKKRKATEAANVGDAAAMHSSFHQDHHEELMIIGSSTHGNVDSRNSDVDLIQSKLHKINYIFQLYDWYRGHIHTLALTFFTANLLCRRFQCTFEMK